MQGEDPVNLDSSGDDHELVFTGSMQPLDGQYLGLCLVPEKEARELNERRPKGIAGMKMVCEVLCQGA